MTVGQRIRALRKKKGLTQVQLGTLCGITGPMISGYERGGTLPKKKALESIAKALEASVSELTGVSQTEPFPQDRGSKSNLLLLEGMLQVLRAEYGCVERKSVGTGDAAASYYLVGILPNRFVLHEKDLRAMVAAAKASVAPLTEDVRRRQAISGEVRKLG